MSTSITELSRQLELSPEVLRKYEKYFCITVERDARGNRFYTEKTIKIFQKIKNLIVQGYTLKEIKPLLNMEYTGCTKVEIIQEKPEEKQDFSFLVKPYESRINELKSFNNSLLTENKQLIASVATLTERVKNKDEIIEILNNQIAEYKARKWWKIWK